MKIHKENYRELEITRLIYVAGNPEGTHTQEAQTPTPEAVKTPEQRAEELARKSGNKANEFREHTTRIDKAINDMVKGVPEGSAANKIAKELRDHKNERFDTILDEYEARYESMGQLDFNESDQFDALVDAADDLADEIVDRIDDDEAGAKKAANEFLAKTPDTVASPAEIKAVKTMIQGNARLRELFGESASVDQLAQGLARKYDVTFKGNNIDYAVDISTVGSSSPTVLTATQLQEIIVSELRGLTTQDKLRDYLKGLGQSITPVSDLRNEVRDIDEWEDFDGHEEVQTLQRMQANVDRQVNTMKERQNAGISARNTEAYLRFDASCQNATEELEGVEIDQYPLPDTEVIQNPNFQLQPLAIRIEGQAVGSLQKVEGGVMIKISGQPDAGPIAMDQIGAELGKGVEKMKEVAAKATKNQEEINAQLGRDGSSLALGEGLTLGLVNTVGNPELSNDAANIQWATMKVGDREVGRLSIKAGGENGERKYVMTVGETTTEFANVTELQAHITESHDTLVASAAETLTDEITQAAAEAPPEVRTQIERAGKMGMMEMLGSLGQLIKLFQEAFKSGDWQTLNDAFSDFNNGLNPQERIKEASATYEAKINTIDKPGDLVTLYREPYGDLAKATFGDGQERIPYRAKLKDIIRDRLATVLGIQITNIEVKPGNILKIESYRGEKKVNIYLENAGPLTFASMKEMGLRAADNTEYELPTAIVPRTEVTSMASLGATLFPDQPAVATEPVAEVASDGAPETPAAAPAATPETPTPTPEAQPQTPKVKAEYADVTGNTMTLKKIGNNVKIQDVLDPSVTEAVIIPAPNTPRRPGVRGRRAEVAIERSGDTYVVKGTRERIRIYNGDRIKDLSTTPLTTPAAAPAAAPRPRRRAPKPRPAPAETVAATPIVTPVAPIEDTGPMMSVMPEENTEPNSSQMPT